MGKRSDFTRNKHDFYPTPEGAVAPLLSWLKPGTRFAEPCAGDGALVRHLTAAGHNCLVASDTHPQSPTVLKFDAMNILWKVGDCFITNPPWTWAVLDPMISHLSRLGPTWMLLSADFMHNKRFSTHLERCEMIVSVGRVKWIPDSPHTGKDNVCWYLFDAEWNGVTEFIGRQSLHPDSSPSLTSS